MARRSAVFARRGRRRRHPRDRPHADAVAGIPDHRAAAGIRAMRAVPDRGSVALRRARSGLVLEQHQSRRAHRHTFRRADSLDLRQGFAEQRGGYDRCCKIYRAGGCDRLLEGMRRQPGFRAHNSVCEQWEARYGKIEPGTGPCCAPTGQSGTMRTMQGSATMARIRRARSPRW